MDVDAVTIDAYGTLVTLVDPVPALQDALRARGVERNRSEVEAAFAAEVEYYVERAHEGRDEATLALLRRDCAEVFLEAAGARGVDPGEFTAAFVSSLRFEPLPGAVDACRALAARGLRLAVVSNWDVGLRDHLAELGLDGLIPVVVTSADAGAPKPSPRVFRLALERLGVEPARALHVGDSEADAEGARAAGMRFAPAPLASAVRTLAWRGWGPRFGGWLGLIGLLALIGYAGRFSGAKPPPDAVFLWSTTANELVLYTFVAIVVLALAIGLPRRETFALRPPPSWRAALAWMVGVFLAVGAVSAIVEPFLHPGREQGLTPTHWVPSHAAQFAANFAVFTFFGPVVEELTFRGLGYTLLVRFGRPVAIVAIGVAFGLWHGLVEALPILFTFGALLAWLRARTASLYPCIALHAFFNGVQLLLALS